MKNPWGDIGEEAAREHVRENLKYWKDGKNFTSEDLLWMSWSGIQPWEVKLEGEVLQGLVRLAALEDNQEEESKAVLRSMSLGAQMKMRKLQLEGRRHWAIEIIRHPELYGPVGDVLDLGWTREGEMWEWIEASYRSWSAYEGVKRLLKRLVNSNQRIPAGLVAWWKAATEGCLSQPPICHRPASETHRNRAILKTIRDLTATCEQSRAGIRKVTKEKVYELVACELNLEVPTVRTIWRRGKAPFDDRYIAPSIRPF